MECASSVPYAEETKWVVLAPTMGAQMYRMGNEKVTGVTVKDDECGSVSVFHSDSSNLKAFLCRRSCYLGVVLPSFLLLSRLGVLRVTLFLRLVLPTFEVLQERRELPKFETIFVMAGTTLMGTILDG
jgi:hypothetical protein